VFDARGNFLCDEAWFVFTHNDTDASEHTIEFANLFLSGGKIARNIGRVFIRFLAFGWFTLCLHLFHM
jgi:hypothetical protein